MQVLTLASPSSLPRARALGRSLKRHQPDWPFEVLLLAHDDVSQSLTEAEEPLRVRSIRQELELDIEALLALHDEAELTALLLPSLLQRYAERSSEPVLHLPSSVWVLADLEPIESALSTRSVLLVPRMTADVPDDGLEPSPAQMEQAGRIEETIIGVEASPDSKAFLAWWNAHVEQALGSRDARKSGDRPEDRHWLTRFLELAPARFFTAVLDDPGCNLNMWNLHRRTLEVAAGGVVVDGRWPARFLNLPGFEPDRPHRLSATASRARVSRSAVLHELCESYATELRQSGWHDPDHHGEVGRRLDGGLVYDDSLRAIYASALALGKSFENLFSAEGTDAFIAWLEGPAPRGSAYGINRYVFHRVARERPDVVRAYPDLDDADGVEYVAWCWSFGRHELAIPDRFMPPRPGQAPARAQESAHAVGPEPAAEASVVLRPDVAASPDPYARDTETPSEDGLAVRLTGYLGHTLGLGAAARGYAQALGAAGVPVRTVTVPLHHLALPVELDGGYGRHVFEDLVHEGAHGFEIVAVNADELPDFMTRLGRDYFEGPRIGIWGWETNSIPPRWQRAFALIDEIWVYSRFMAENIGAVAPVPVIVLPPPVERPSHPAEPLRLGVPAGFLFLFVFDYLSTVQRKNPVGLIEAFKGAFASGEGPQLLIKTINAPLRPLAEEEVLWAAHGREDIHVIDRSLSGEELTRLMAACDCYVSLHRAEGFGLTMAEAMAIGKPVIGTGYSGNVDFMHSENSYLVDYAIGRVGAECEIYPPEGEWAEPSIEHAAELIRRVYGNPQEAARIGARAREDVARTLSPQATGAAMRRRLQELAERAPGRRTSIH
jgi:glycosyltransferase involved in cell wall biosynthesis